MNTYLKHALLLLLLAGTTSCVSDDPPIDPLKAEGTTYTDLNGLNLTYNGNPEVGKSVKVVFDSKNRSKGYIVGWSNFDTRLIPGMPEQFAGVVPGPGILPGEEQLILPVTFSTQGETTKFDGTAETDYLHFDYSGAITGNSLTLDITNARLRDTSLAGTAWKLQPPVLDADPAAPIKKSPFILDWGPKDKTTVDIDGMKVPAEDIMMQILNVFPLATFGTDYITVAQLASSTIRSIEFKEDGNVTITSVNPLNPLMETTNPANSIQYVVTGKGKMQLYLNPQQLILESRAGTSVSPLVQMLTVISHDLVPLVSTGIPLQLTMNGEVAEMELGNGLPLKVLRGAVLPLVSNRAFMSQLFSWLDELPGAEQIAPVATPFFGSLPGIIGATTEFRLGLELVPAK